MMLAIQGESDAVDVLRIIAKDEKRLSKQDRESLAEIADELDRVTKNNIAMQSYIADQHQKLWDQAVQLDVCQKALAVHGTFAPIKATFIMSGWGR